MQYIAIAADRINSVPLQLLSKLSLGFLRHLWLRLIPSRYEAAIGPMHRQMYLSIISYLLVKVLAKFDVVFQYRLRLKQFK